MKTDDTSARQYAIDVLARLRERIERTDVDAGDVFEVAPESVSAARVMRLANECQMDYRDLF